MRKLSHEDVMHILPDREANGHKGDFGKVLLLCGSRGYTGAAALTAMGALRSGAGLVYLGVPESIYAIEAVKLTEPVVFPLSDEGGMLSSQAIPEILKKLSCMSAVVIGCGMGQSAGTLSVLEAVMENAGCPVIVDADGINLLARHMDLLRNRKHPTILTPHDGEFARFGISGENRVAESIDFAQENGCILLRKGHRTLITDGTVCFENRTGNPGMATGGSGDILAGMIAALAGQGIDPVLSAAAGAWLHGAAGDVCAEQMGTYGMLPTDMLEVLPRLMK